MNPKDATSSLDHQIGLLEADLAVPSERDVKQQQLTDLKRQKKDRDAAQVLAEAKTRMLAIVRAHGSLADLLTSKDTTKLGEAAQAFAEAVRTLNDRYEKLIGLRHEAQALAEIFGLEMPTLATVVVPALRPAVQEAFEITSRVGVRDNGFVRPSSDVHTGRRTYDEAELGESRALIRRKQGG